LFLAFNVGLLKPKVEAFLRLVDQSDVQWQSRAHFFGIAAQMMRRTLVEEQCPILCGMNYEPN
jgi:hypothetical protein